VNKGNPAQHPFSIIFPMFLPFHAFFQQHQGLEPRHGRQEKVDESGRF
jgi:hypothetical protein